MRWGEWLADDSGYDEEVFPVLRAELGPGGPDIERSARERRLLGSSPG